MHVINNSVLHFRFSCSKKLLPNFRSPRRILPLYQKGSLEDKLGIIVHAFFYKPTTLPICCGYKRFWLEVEGPKIFKKRELNNNSLFSKKLYISNHTIRCSQYHLFLDLSSTLPVLQIYLYQDQR